MCTKRYLELDLATPTEHPGPVLVLHIGPYVALITAIVCFMKALAQPKQNLLYFPTRTSSIALWLGVRGQAFPGEIAFPTTAIEPEKRASIGCS